MSKLLGRNIKAARVKKGLTQQELADLLGKSKSIVQKYEAGTTEAPLSVLYSIAIALDMRFSELVNTVDPGEEYDKKVAARKRWARILANTNRKAQEEDKLKYENLSTGDKIALDYFRPLNDGNKDKAVDYMAYLKDRQDKEKDPEQ